MRSSRLQTQCFRALRSSVQTTPRSSNPARQSKLQLPPSRPFHCSSNLLKKSSLSMNPKASSPNDAPAGTNFSDLDVLGNTPAPSTSVDVCMHNGFGLNSGVTISDGDGALLVNGEAFSWRPWEVTGEKRLINGKGQIDIPREAFGVLEVLWPRPDLLIIGVGKETRPLSPATRKALSEMGLRVDIMDTRNAAAQFNMLATERGVGDVAAALVPIGWEEGIGAV